MSGTLDCELIRVVDWPYRRISFQRICCYWFPEICQVYFHLQYDRVEEDKLTKSNLFFRFCDNKLVDLQNGPDILHYPFKIPFHNNSPTIISPSVGTSKTTGDCLNSSHSKLVLVVRAALARKSMHTPKLWKEKYIFLILRIGNERVIISICAVTYWIMVRYCIPNWIDSYFIYLIVLLDVKKLLFVPSLRPTSQSDGQK